VIRLWDLRRLIVPLSYFLEKPFYSWTRHAATYIGSAVFYLDYAAPIDVVRQKATALVEQSKLASGKVTSVQVTNTSPQAIEVKVLVSADSAGNASNLCAELREQLIAFLLKEHPEALPRQRNETIDAARKV
jgi:small-conductance mechanosensitive channel